MSDLLFIDGLFLIKIWALGFFVFPLGKREVQMK
jgi:hypothetical protein